jgi:hypothetical protein
VEGAAVQTHMQKTNVAQPAAPPSQSQPPGGSTQYSNEGITDRNLQGQQSKQNQQNQGKSSQSNSKTDAGSKP